MSLTCRNGQTHVPMEPAQAFQLGGDEAHVWYAWTAACDTPTRYAYYLSLLSDEERARLDRFAFEYLKLEYLVTRALCRTVLSAYDSIAPASWRFRTNAYGRPEIAAASGAQRLRFNLSNARSLVACVVTSEVDAGIDVEEINRRGVMSIAERSFSRIELRALHALPAEHRQQRFFELWTLKESYIKARGVGLQSIPLDQFSFLLQEPPIRIDFDPRLDDCATAWQFQLFQPTREHLMAVGIRRSGRPNLRISVREVEPDVRLLWRDVPCG